MELASAETEGVVEGVGCRWWKWPTCEVLEVLEVVEAVEVVVVVAGERARWKCGWMKTTHEEQTIATQRDVQFACNHRFPKHFPDESIRITTQIEDGMTLSHW